MIVDQSEYHSSVHSYDLQFVFQSDLIDKDYVHQQNTVFDQGNSQQGRCGEHRYDMHGPKDKLGDGGSYHNVPSGLYGSDSTQKQYHQVTYDQSYYNNHYGKLHHCPFDNHY
jgi:hypothetical protein